MASLFYFKTTSSNTNSELIGPFKVNQILLQIVKKEKTPKDLISLQKDSQWTPIYQREEFQSYFKTQPKEQGWTLLKKINNQFLSSGPYLKEGLQILLCKGIISDKDFVWTQPMPAWERISLCPAFHTRLDSKIEDLFDKMSLDYEGNEKPATYYKRPLLEEPPLPDTWSK